MGTILQVEHLEKYYGNKGNLTKAIDDLSFSVEQGEYIGIMGASGSGKTTLLIASLRLTAPPQATFTWKGRTSRHLTAKSSQSSAARSWVLSSGF